MSATLSYALEGAVARLELSRPERHNAVDREMLDALEEALDWLEGLGDRLRAVVLGGAGRSFSSGADLQVLGGLGAAQARHFMLAATWSFRRLERLPVPVIAAAKGYCLGGGFELLLHCDLVIAAEDAVLALPEATLGLTTTAGSVARLVSVVGAARARDLLLTGRRVNAVEARAMGLVAEVVPRADLERAADARAGAFARQPAAGIAATKRLLARVLEPRVSASFLAEVEAFEGLLRDRVAARDGGEHAGS